MEPVTALSPIPLRNNHLALIGGLPCSATYFAAELCRDLLARKHGSCEVVVLNDLGEATLQKIAAIDHPVLFLTEIPDRAVASALGQSDFPILLIDQSFSDASRDFIAVRTAKLLDTVRTMARAQVGLNALLEIPRSDLLAANHHEPAATLAQQIAIACDIDPALCGLMIGERELDRPLQDATEIFFARERPSRSDEATRLLDELDRFYSFHPDRIASSWHMPIDLLVEAAPPYLPATDPLQLLGPARCLTIGPYLHLSSGSWKSILTFTSSANQSTNMIGFDVTADEEIKSDESFEVKVDGIFSVEFGFQIEDPYYPFEFRSHLRRGSIDGELRLHSLELQKYG